MKIPINGKFYTYNDKAITALRFRSFFGYSFINEYYKENADKMELLIKLVYIAIGNFEMSIEKFVKECEADKYFLSASRIVKDNIYRIETKETDSKVESDKELDFDEFKIAAQMSICHIPDRFLDEFSLFQITEIINYYVDMKYPGDKPVLLSQSDAKSLLGIDGAKEEKIRIVLEKQEIF